MSQPARFVITGTSDIHPGVHALNIYGGMHPVRGKAVGRLSPDRVAEMRQTFASREVAQAVADERNANPDALWLHAVTPEADVL